jgi:hypothetical protein
MRRLACALFDEACFGKSTRSKLRCESGGKPPHSKMNIPLHLIAGALGVGKTTAIRRFVAQSPDYVAVLVNDFGETGYDAALIGEAGGGKIQVENVPGGCLCCTSAATQSSADWIGTLDPHLFTDIF